jgi:hypothetical protein
MPGLRGGRRGPRAGRACGPRAAAGTGSGLGHRFRSAPAAAGAQARRGAAGAS